MVDVIGRAKIIVESTIDKSSLNTSSSKLGAGIKTGALIGVAALGTLTAASIKAVSAFEESESVQRKLNNTLKNMGKTGAVEELDKLSNSLMRKTGVDDEVIKSGQTILATFSKVADSAGEVGGAFDRASRLSLDLAATGFGSVDSASKALGKALQDPEKGIAALNKAGVTFTPTQKEMIANFVKTGETGKAQNLILAEVEKQVGGNAEAGAKASKKLKSAIGEAQENLGGLIADLFEDKGKKKSLVELAADATFKFSDAVKKFQASDSWKALRKAIRDYAKDLGTIAGALGDIVGYMNELSGKKATGDSFLSFLGKLAKYTTPIRVLAESIRFIQQAAEDNNFSLGDTLVRNIFGSNPFNAGGGRVSSGLRVVGENGPEIISMGSGGGYVHNNSETRAILSNASGASVTNINNFYGPENLAEARRNADWQTKYGTRFGAATAAGAL